MSAVTLSELAARLPDCELIGQDLIPQGIEIDSRQVEPGSIFAAIVGSTLDGRRFIPGALAAGASALLLTATAEPGDREMIPENIPRLLCADPRKCAGLIAQILAGEPARSLELLGVTGTNGKSTCVHLMGHLEDGPRHRWGVLGTLRFDAGGETEPSSHTTPDPINLARLLARSMAAGYHGVAMEVSSHALDQDRVAGCSFSGVLMTNVSRDHLDYHGDMDSYLAAKGRILEARRPGAPGVLNRDDARLAGLLERGGEQLVSFGRHRDADFRITDEENLPGGSGFKLSWDGGEHRFQVGLVGAFNISNVAGVLALLISLGRSPELLAASLIEFGGVPGRMETVTLPGGPRVIIDFAHTPDAVAKVLAAARPLCRGRLLAILGAGGDRDRGKRALMGQALQQGCDIPWLSSDNPRSEDPAQILDDMEKGMDPAADRWRRDVDRGRAIGLALAECTAEDMLVILGKGHEETQEIGGQFIPFSDKGKVLSAWREMGGGG
jgi:UDP-N-acetylmuramoyl-L-alanyl-D-glutamate--2,6-diaminopimelate ligase